MNNKYKISSKLYDKNNVIKRHCNETKNILEDIYLEKKNITNQLLQQQKQIKLKSDEIQKFKANINMPDKINESEYWTSKKYFLPMFSYIQTEPDNKRILTCPHNCINNNSEHN